LQCVKRMLLFVISEYNGDDALAKISQFESFDSM
jgi:hypothetical protein